jgi:hypothetical protein
MSVSFSYYVGQPPTAITPEDPQWRAALPLNRHAAAAQPQTAAAGELSYGDYFDAARRFLIRDGMAVALCAVSEPGAGSCPGDIDHIRVELSKHGAFYHPSKVILEIGAQRRQMVLNVAISDAGRAVLDQEYSNLARLNALGHGYLPRLFGRGAERIGDKDMEIFAAEWLEGFCEFHLSPSPEGAPRWQVWGDRGERWDLNRGQVFDLYRQAVAILTRYYHPVTFEAVSGWHHAAGDFIVSAEARGLLVRLITVRRYAPLFRLEEEHTPNIEEMLEGLTAFFVDTSLRMRLDRDAGVGELVWAPDEILPAIWEGFIQGLEQTVLVLQLPAEIVPAVQRYLALHPPEDLLEIGNHIVGRYPHDSEDRRIIERHLTRHMQRLGEILTAEA